MFRCYSYFKWGKRGFGRLKDCQVCTTRNCLSQNLNERVLSPNLPYRNDCVSQAFLISELDSEGVYYNPLFTALLEWRHAHLIIPFPTSMSPKLIFSFSATDERLWLIWQLPTFLDGHWFLNILSTSYNYLPPFSKPQTLSFPLPILFIFPLMSLPTCVPDGIPFILPCSALLPPS